MSSTQRNFDPLTSDHNIGPTGTCADVLPCTLAMQSKFPLSMSFASGPKLGLRPKPPLHLPPPGESLDPLVRVGYHFQSINQNLYSAPSRSLYSEALPTQAKRKSTVLRRWWNCGIENKHHLEGALDLLEVHSRLLDQPPKRNMSALSQSGRVGPPHYLGQRTAVYDGLHQKREGDRALADRRAPSQTSTATPSTRSCMRCAVGMEASAIHPAYIGICGQTS